MVADCTLLASRNFLMIPPCFDILALFDSMSPSGIDMVALCDSMASCNFMDCVATSFCTFSKWTQTLIKYSSKVFLLIEGSGGGTVGMIDLSCRIELFSVECLMLDVGGVVSVGSFGCKDA